MPLRTTGLQGLAEWHLVCLCRSRQRLIASSDPTSNQRTLSSGRLPIMGCATHRTIPPHTSTEAQTGRQDRRRGALGASRCPCAEITTRGQCIGYCTSSYLCCRPRPDSRPHRRDIQPDMHLTLLPRNRPLQEQFRTEITEILSSPS